MSRPANQKRGGCATNPVLCPHANETPKGSCSCECCKDKRGKVGRQMMPVIDLQPPPPEIQQQFMASMTKALQSYKSQISYDVIQGQQQLQGQLAGQYRTAQYQGVDLGLAQWRNATTSATSTLSAWWPQGSSMYATMNNPNLQYVWMGPPYMQQVQEQPVPKIVPIEAPVSKKRFIAREEI